MALWCSVHPQTGRSWFQIHCQVVTKLDAQNWGVGLGGGVKLPNGSQVWLWLLLTAPPGQGVGQTWRTNVTLPSVWRLMGLSFCICRNEAVSLKHMCFLRKMLENTSSEVWCLIDTKERSVKYKILDTLLWRIWRHNCILSNRNVAQSRCVI